MRAEKLFEALGLVDDRLIEEAADARRTATPWRRWMPLAASLVLVVGLGSVSFGLMLRGCGGADTTSASEAAPAATEEAAYDTDGAVSAETPECAPMAPSDNGAGMSGSAAPEPAETPEDAPADTPEEAPAKDGPASAPGLEPMELGAGPVMTLSTDGDGLEAERTLELAISADHADVIDQYRITNAGSEAVEAEFTYPVAGNLASLQASGLALTADQGILHGETAFTSARYAYEADGYNLARRDWTALSAHRGEEVTPLDLAQTVTLWEVQSVDCDRSAGNAALSVTFEKPANTRLLYNGFSTQGTKDGLTFCEDEVTLDPGARRELIFLGKAPAGWSVACFDPVHREISRPDVTCEVSVRTLSLGDYLRTLTASDLEQDTLAELLSLDLRASQSGDLRRLAHQNLRAGHIFDQRFRLTIPAGETVALTATFQQLGCWSEAGNFAYEILCGDTGSLRLTAQTARVTIWPGVTCEANDLPLDEAATIEPGQQYQFVIS